MELRHLRYFVAVAEEGSFRKAAEKRLHTAQPSLSRQIRDLESMLKVALINRSRHGMSLTPAGQVFLEHARLILAQAKAAIEAARASGPTKTRFVVGFLTGHEIDLLPRLLQVLGREIEKIELVVHSASSPELIRALEQDAMDMAFLRPDGTATGLIFRPLLEEELFVLMPANHSLSWRQTVPPEALQAHPFISASRSSAPVLRRVVDDYLDRCGITLALVHEAETLPMAISLMQSARGVTLLPAYMSRLLPAWVTRRPIVGSPPTITLAIGFNRANQSFLLHNILTQQRGLAEPSA